MKGFKTLMMPQMSLAVAICHHFQSSSIVKSNGIKKKTAKKIN